MTPPLFTVQEGEGRLLISVPHAGVFIPEHIAGRLTRVGRAVVDTDWHVDQLYDFAAEMGATLLVAQHSRIVVDLNRSPAGNLLYPGQVETGICPTQSFDGAALYERPPDAAEMRERIETSWQPYHQALRTQLERVQALHGSVRLLDAHSIRSVIPRLFTGTLPELNYGTNSGASAEATLVSRAMTATAEAGFSQVLDGRFRGGFITRHYGAPGAGVHAIQLELAQSTYRDETSAPEGLDPVRAARLVTALRKLVGELLRA